MKNPKTPYPILIERGLLQRADLFESLIHGESVCVITNTTIAPLYLTSLLQTFSRIKSINQVDHLILPDGEVYKTLKTVEIIWQFLIEKGHHRTTTLIALGGGVINDLVGFAASCYLRGVSWITCPTTLLAQVDASIGGKTGVNHALGKNMIGSFYAPLAVLSDVNTLSTLPELEYISGLAEVVKLGLALDAHFFAWLEDRVDLILRRDPETLLYLVSQSSSIKAKIVEEDYFEQGKRQWLNFGHTLGHALEAHLGYTMSHGCAVSLGMVLAMRLSLPYGFSEESCDRGVKLLSDLGLPCLLPLGVQPEAVIDFMQRDKKNRRKGMQRWVILRGLGVADIVEGLEWSLERELNSMMT